MHGDLTSRSPSSQQHTIDGAISFWKSVRSRPNPRNLPAVRRGSLPAKVDLRPKFSEFGLPICSQAGPYCWDYTTIGVLEYEASAELGQRLTLSPGYLAWAAQETDSQGTGGSNFGRANRGLENYGMAPLSMGGVPVASGSIPTPLRPTIEIGQTFGDVDFHWIRFWGRTPLTTDQITAIKTDIANGHPVAVGMQWPNQASFVPGTFVLKVPRKNRVFDGHCVILIGYEDDPTLPGGGVFLFRNSWGQNWGDDGYAKMPYALLNFCINDAFSIRKISPKFKSPPQMTRVYEAISLMNTSENVSAVILQDMTRFGNAWKGKPQLFLDAKKSGDEFSLNVPVQRKGNYDIQLLITRAESYGQFRVIFPDGKSSGLVDGAGPGVSRSQPIDLGVHFFRQGSQRLRFRVEGQSTASSGLGIGIHEIQITGAP